MLNTSDSPRYDVAIIGGGAVGTMCALAHAQRDARVVVFEASQEGPNPLKGEWLHPPAVRMLQQVGIHFDSSSATKGFVVFPEDDFEPIPLTYADEATGLVCPHDTLVRRLREAALNEPNIDVIWQRARPERDGWITYTQGGIEVSITADRLVGADGRGSVMLRLLGHATKPVVCSRMIGMHLEGVSLPLESYGHIFHGEHGPIFVYRSGVDSVSAVVDVPRDYSGDEAIELLRNSYAPRLPPEIRAEFLEALSQRRFKLAGNTLRPRISYGNSRFVVIGDAAGHYHPMTAVGLTLGFGDAVALAESKDFNEFVKRRYRDIRTPEMLAMGLYEIFVDHRAETKALRHAVYRIWRAGGDSADRSVRLLACDDTTARSLALVGATVVALAIGRTIPRSVNPRAWLRAGGSVYHLLSRIGWFVRATRQLSRSRSKGEAQNSRFHHDLSRAFLTSALPPEPLQPAEEDQGHGTP